MNSQLPHIRRDLTELYGTDRISAAEKLNIGLKQEVFSTKREPMYFTGVHDSPTVFVMLNPGGANDDSTYSFRSEGQGGYDGPDQFITHHIEVHRNFGIRKYGESGPFKVDNFDLKQASFLMPFADSGIHIPDFIAAGKEDDSQKGMAIRNVMMQKLQLELIPYRSREFTQIMSSPAQAAMNLELLYPFLNIVLDTLIERERNYVLFGAKQFYHLLAALGNAFHGSVRLHQIKSDHTLGHKKKNSVNHNCVEINHKGRQIRGLIAHTFPRRDLPNAFARMREYGKICYQGFRDTFG